jgi:methionine sulfoxide reductase heme-binding subunit
MTSDPSTHLFWITSRAAGTTALVLSSAAVGVGLAMGRRIPARKSDAVPARKSDGLPAGAASRLGGAPERRTIHETLALATMVAIAVHGLALVGDGYLRPSLLDVSVPLIFSYKTLWTSLGIISAWGLIFLGLSYYLRRRIGMRRWRIIHRFTVLAWLGGIVHAFGEGTDAGQLWFVLLIALVLAPAAALLIVRLAPFSKTRDGNPRAPHRRAGAALGAK